MRKVAAVVHVLVCALWLHGGSSGAQVVERQSVVRIQVVDSAGGPLANADVSVVEGLARVIAAGVTDSAGFRGLTVPSSGSYQVIARRLGYQRASLFFVAVPGSMVVRVTLVPSAVALPGVAVNADVDLNRKSYHLDADDIANSERPVLDGWDALKKLRPDMMNARVPGIAYGVQSGTCTIHNIWINGKLISFVPANDRLALEKRHVMAAQAAAHGPGGPMYSGISTVPTTVLSVLASIRPEHIAEINYADCSDTTVAKARGRNAVFVALKPGVKFEPGLGTYVDEIPVVAANHTRLIGVFDEGTGQPIEGVQVIDTETGTFALTTVTGTAALAFLPDGTHTIRVRKASYADQTIEVVISALESGPITLVMTSASKLH